MVVRHYDNENPTVRRAFIFCLYCGLRFCNVKDLTYKNVDYANRLLEFEQNKTKGHSASSGVVIPLNDGLLSIIGEAPTDKKLFDIRIVFVKYVVFLLLSLSQLDVIIKGRQAMRSQSTAHIARIQTHCLNFIDYFTVIYNR